MAATAAQEHSSIDIRLKRPDRVYRAGEIVEGIIVIRAYKGWSHNGVVMVADGIIHLSTATRGLSIGTDSSTKQIPLFKYETEVAGKGSFADGSTDIPFEFVVAGSQGQSLLESYHGVYVSIIYTITVTCDRGMMKKSLSKEIEFIIEVPTGKVTTAIPASFDISPESLENVSPAVLATIPRFKVSGRLHRSNCNINQPFTGELKIEQSVAPIRSLELQLVRVETVGEGKAAPREATEIQNIQIGEGNVCRDMVVPMYMVFPRLFSCPTVVAANFKIEFEINLIVVFGDGYMITEVCSAPARRFTMFQCQILAPPPLPLLTHTRTHTHAHTHANTTNPFLALPPTRPPTTPEFSYSNLPRCLDMSDFL